MFDGDHSPTSRASSPRQIDQNDGLRIRRSDEFLLTTACDMLNKSAREKAPARCVNSRASPSSPGRCPKNPPRDPPKLAALSETPERHRRVVPVSSPTNCTTATNRRYCTMDGTCPAATSIRCRKCRLAARLDLGRYATRLRRLSSQKLESLWP